MFRPIAVVMIACVFALPATAAEPTAADKALSEVRQAWKDAEREFQKAYESVKTEEDLKALKAKQPDKAKFAARFLEVADTHPKTDAELVALVWAARCAPKSEAGEKAAARLPKRIESLKTLAPLVRAYDQYWGGDVDEVAGRDLTPILVAKVKALPDDPDAAHVLSQIVCAAFAYDSSEKPPAAFAAAADLLADKYASSPNTMTFSSVLSDCPPAYARQFEKHVRRIAEKADDPFAKAYARFALGTLALAEGEKRQAEAEKMFREIVAEYDGKGRDFSFVVPKAQLLADRIKRCGLGKPAQKTEGDDLEGKPVTLADQKGKVVVLVFWASWCGACMADVPHEKELVEKFKGRPFAILGVNGDLDKEEAMKAVKKAGISWRSIWGGEKGPGGPQARAWCVGGWPAVFVIDHTGVIRHNSLRGKALDEPLEELVKAAEKAVQEKK